MNRVIETMEILKLVIFKSAARDRSGIGLISRRVLTRRRLCSRGERDEEAQTLGNEMPRKRSWQT
ncbi:hypothetical protein F2Q69_00002261 [Brassica cretica]|uniref:Uncharacterized protein n=1 Tax=Brassica cretica TaxID=69181 RepID=A0A8S9NVL7_BRACR|nr:hypothetical protein F2Q69_00002261 [Brassica cretica]